MRHSLFPLLLITTTACLNAQPATRIMAGLNEQFAAFPQGALQVKSYWKSMNKTDTTFRTAQMYFFRNEPFADSFCLFFIERPSEGILHAYDGQTYYEVFVAEKVIWTEQVRFSGGIRNRLQKSSAHALAYQPILNNTPIPAYPIDRFSLARMDTLDSNLRITASESFHNPLKILPKDPDSGTTRWIYTFQLPELTLRRAEIWAIIGDKVQYADYHLSTIEPLPEQTGLNDLFPLDSLIQEGYILRDMESAYKQRRALSPPIQVNDTLPPFELPLLSGGIVASTTVENGLVLYDFWFKNCPACHLVIPILNRLHLDYGTKGLHVFGINSADKDLVRLADFVQDREIAYPTLLDTDRGYFNTLRLQGAPVLVLAEAGSGKVLYVSYGRADNLEVELRTEIEKRL
ncbi:MAG: TlpA disulfide reductase family protein [Saprospiraceae bacterium]|nr:TlpA disulfide reductase family protein [Saprospiraceae bacterium]